MNAIGVGVVVLLALVVLAAVMNPQAVKRIFGAARAQVGKAGRAAENADPLANYQQAVDDAATQLSEQLDAKVEAETSCTSLARQVEQNAKDKAKLENRIQKAIADNDEAKQTRSALELAKVEQDMETNQTQLAAAQKNLTSLAKLIDRNRQKIKDARDAAKRAGQQLKQSAVMAAAAEKFSSATGGNDLLEGLDSQLSKVQEQIDRNNAKIKVAQEACQGELDDLEEEEAQRKEAAAEILARFKPKPVEQPVQG